jgi:hypothetical protein
MELPKKVQIAVAVGDLQIQWRQTGSAIPMVALKGYLRDES